MSARLSLYQKAEEELYKLDSSVKAKFYNFSHQFRQDPWKGLSLKALKGAPNIYSARIGADYRALLTRTGIDDNGTESWLLIAVRHRSAVYEQLSVTVNRISGEIEFVDLSVVGQSALNRAGIMLTPATIDDDEASAPTEVRPPEVVEPAAALLADCDFKTLHDLGVADSLISLALSVTSSDELDDLVKDAPLLSKDVLYGLAAGMSVDEVRAEITGKVAAEGPIDPDDFTAALARTTVTSVDDNVRNVLEEGDFRAWKVFLHPTQRALVDRKYSGPARVSGGPGTGKTIVALHRVRHLAEQLPDGSDRPILLTTFTKNLAADLRARLASLLDPDALARVDVLHIDQLAARVVGENAAPGQGKNRVADSLVVDRMRALLEASGEQRWEAEFLVEEWEQVVLGQSLATRSDYFRARRAGRGRPLNRAERGDVWKLIEQLTATLDTEGVETWGQAADRAARFEIERAAAGKYRYDHVVVDEAQDLRPAHWKMLRAMVPAGPDDLFLTGDTHQRIYDNQVALGTVGVQIRGRSSRLTLSYRTTREILTTALEIMSGETVDDLDDGTDTLEGYRSVLHGPAPDLRGYASWNDELHGLVETVRWWHTEFEASGRDPRGLVAVCVPDHRRVGAVITTLTGDGGFTCAELTKDGPRGDGDIHVGTMHRFKGLEYQRLAIVGVSDGVVPRAAIIRLQDEDPARYLRERRRDRALLFMAATRARDALAVSWHDKPSQFLPH
ncbi:UvrD-helicase domain-containing protein [Cryptosporangium arvum]|uniref:DNA 3'-5' helicase n=1 Tax=Cryptosporangium arvum DSM 44712 TaxID=927661 RepID=A0A010Z3Q2_9ACTN|nr:UvrD-helicase domain-containing protein [Cryptosporangium arvum]EXG82023.1 DNA/RNA helicase, superfamily I [Cryptosporangium arvum DSM 44712]